MVPCCILSNACLYENKGKWNGISFKKNEMLILTKNNAETSSTLIKKIEVFRDIADLN